MTRVAIVTGGTRGIGRAICERLRDEREFTVIANYAGNDDAARKFTDETGIATIKFDVGDFDAVQDACGKVAEEHGPIDVVVNNAGITRDGTLLKMSYEDWDAVMRTNLGGCFNLAKATFSGMKERGWGRIINILNTGAKSPRAGSTPTTVSRAAGLSLTKSLSLEYAADGILVNALCTGLIVTDQLASMRDRNAPDKTLEEFQDFMGGRIPLGRMGTAEEYANVACLLASDAGGYVTGTAINIDGGSSPVT